MINNYLIRDSSGAIVDSIRCSESDDVPEGFTKELIPDGKIWDGRQLIQFLNQPKIVQIETI
jgi:hypothetical protein